MRPEVLGVSSYFLLWGVGAVAGLSAGFLLAVRHGFPPLRSAVALLALALALLAGTKALFAVEMILFPEDAPFRWTQERLGDVLRLGFRSPGGVLAVVAVLPPLCRALCLPVRSFADATFPAVGLALFFARFGCLLNGCCFGQPTQSPLAVVFPAGSQPYRWQIGEGLISFGAEYCVPIHPLQVYFMLLGLGVFVLGLRWQRTKTWEGQVWARSALLFFAGSALLELLGARPLRSNVLAGAIGIAAAGAMMVRAERGFLSAWFRRVRSVG